MQIVDEVVDPDAAGVLIHTHGPESHHLLVRVRIDLCEPPEPVRRHTGFGHRPLERVGPHILDELLVAHVRPGIRIGPVLGIALARVVRAQSVTDIVNCQVEADMFVDEVLVDRPGSDDVIGNVIEDDNVGIGLHYHRQIGQFERSMLEHRQHCHLGALVRQAPIGNPGPEDRMHFRHVCAPEHEGIGMFDIVIHAHWLIGAKGPHEARYRRGHAVSCVGIDIVGPEASLEQLECRVTFPDRPLP